ncbi:MAG: hypothetical protein JWR25_1320 [Noviherbaspirillum sp.]|nr:hypothetical protein [Noviherbaspirillum sp.]
MKKCAMNNAENGPIRNFTIRRSRDIPRFRGRPQGFHVSGARRLDAIIVADCYSFYL